MIQNKLMNGMHQEVLLLELVKLVLILVNLSKVIM